MPGDKILGVFVRDALSKKSGETKSTFKCAVGADSKMFSTYRKMDSHEIVQDVSQFNIWRKEEKSKPPINASQVQSLAVQMQQGHFSTDAKRKQNQFDNLIIQKKDIQ